MTPHNQPPDGARFVMLQLDSGKEVVGWHDRILGFVIKSNFGGTKPNVTGWRELNESEINKLGLNE